MGHHIFIFYKRLQKFSFYLLCNNFQKTASDVIGQIQGGQKYCYSSGRVQPIIFCICPLTSLAVFSYSMYSISAHSSFLHITELTHAKTPNLSNKRSIPAFRLSSAQPGPAFRMRIPAGPSENTTPIRGLSRPLVGITPL